MSLGVPLRNKEMPRRIRIFFINCPTLDIDAAAYLILAQNKQQSVFQFEIHHFHIYSDRTEGVLTGKLNGPIYRVAEWLEDKSNWLERNSRLWNVWFLGLGKLAKRIFYWLNSRKRVELDLRAAPLFGAPIVIGEWYPKLHEIVEKYDQWVEQRAKQHPPANNFDSFPGPSIVITESFLENHFISFSNRDLSIISAHEWKAFFWPISALEYILASVQRVSLYIAFGQSIHSHYPTRSCLWDYSINQPDFRYSVLLGLLCETCRNQLGKAIGPERLMEFNRFLENRWIHEDKPPSSIAGTLWKIYGYEISRATGLSPSIGSSLRHYIRTGFGQAISESIKLLIVSALTAFAVYELHK